MSYNPIKFTMLDGIDYVLEEKGNTFIAMRKIAWGEAEEGKIDIRKWFSQDEGDTPGKGVTLTDEGCDELTVALIKEGFGDTKEIIDELKTREDFKSICGGIPDIIEDDGLDELDLDLELEEDGEDLFDPEAIFG